MILIAESPSRRTEYRRYLGNAGEYIARTALTRIINQDVLWPHFGNTAALEKFWALLPDERRKTWGDPIDPMVPVANFDPKNLHDGRLGKT